MLVINNKNTKYDYDHDVLHAYFGEENNSSAEEVETGIYIYKDDTSDKIIKITFIDFNKRYHSIRAWMEKNNCTISDDFIL